MGLMDDVIVNAKNVADTACKKAGKVVDKAKLRINIAELNSNISKKHELLGTTLYNKIKSGELSLEDSDIAKLCSEIDELMEQRNAVDEHIKQSKSVVFCALCGHENNKGSAFCSSCGNKLES